MPGEKTKPNAEDVEDAEVFQSVAGEQLWTGVVELLVPAGTIETQDGLSTADDKGFTNVVTWADSSEGFIAKVQSMCSSYGWYLIGIERSNPIDAGAYYSNEISDLIERAEVNPNAILIGTFHTYGPE